MAKISFSGEFSPKMPNPIGAYSFAGSNSSAVISYAGYQIVLSGDFAYDLGNSPFGLPETGHGTAYRVSIASPSGTVLFENVAASLGSIVEAVKSLDLTALVDGLMSGPDTVQGGGEIRFGGGGNDTLEWTDNGTVFGGSGSDTYQSIHDSKTHTITKTEFGTVLGTTYDQSSVTLVGVEQIKFTDVTVAIDGSAPAYDDAAAARTAILRQPSDQFSLYQDGEAGSENALIARLVAEAADSTVPALVVYEAIMGKTPLSGRLDSLAAFVKDQINSDGYQASLNPRLGGYEALGLGLSDTAEFKAHFGAGGEADMIRAGYQQFFGRSATEAQTQHFAGQIDYFEGLYIGVGIDPGLAAMKARGAVVGQMLGYAAEEGGALKADATAWLTAAANGNAHYGQPFDLV